MNPREVIDVVEHGIRSPAADPQWEVELEIREPSNIIEERASATTSAAVGGTTCGPDDNTGICVKPVTSASLSLPIALAVIIPVVAISIALFYLHKRGVRRQQNEDRNYRHASLDFGLGEVHRVGGKGSDGIGGDEYGSEKRPRQLSMDMHMNSPYILPPEVHNSRESLHSLSRNLRGEEDPYRQVTTWVAEGNGSIRSARPQNDTSSNYTRSSGTPSRFREGLNAELLPNAAKMSRSGSPASFVPPPRLNSLQQPAPAAQNPFNSPLPASPLGSDNNSPVDDPRSVIQVPAPVARKDITPGLPSNPRPGMNTSLAAPVLPSEDNRESFMGKEDFRNSNNYLGAFIHREASPAPPAPINKDEAPTIVEKTSPPPSIKTLPSNPRPERKQSLPVAQTAVIEDGSDYGDDFKVTPPSPVAERGQRYSMDVPPEQFAQAGLGAPGFDPRRISMGFRPLPPNAATEHDDPEIRANRIRSFYKEYFDESKPAPQGQYYEDYDENYLGDAAYFDPNQGNFVMPYAEPVTRRAMTPPPRAQRFMGQGQQRGRQGSMGSAYGGSAYGGSQAGGFAPPRFQPGPRAMSSASGRMPPPGPRSYSTQSARPQQRGRPLPPPEALTSLPTPSKLKDDTFALMHSIDFAPPVSYRDRQLGRSESPLGERRDYNPSVPAHRPLASAFEELAPMPSPHLLRKSGTFTGLDFAPPRKFRDPENASDAGSIRSNRSGISQMTNNAIRQGAYRVSRLPGDQVFSKMEMTDVLKPSWDLGKR